MYDNIAHVTRRLLSLHKDELNGVILKNYMHVYMYKPKSFESTSKNIWHIVEAIQSRDKMASVDTTYKGQDKYEKEIYIYQW